MAKLGFGLYKEQIKDCIYNNIEKILFILLDIWLLKGNIERENIVLAIFSGVVLIVFTILFIFTLRDTIKAIKEYLKIRKEWENYGK